MFAGRPWGNVGRGCGSSQLHSSVGGQLFPPTLDCSWEDPQPLPTLPQGLPANTPVYIEGLKILPKSNVKKFTASSL